MNCSSEMWLGISGRAGTHDGGEKGIVVSYATGTTWVCEEEEKKRNGMKLNKRGAAGDCIFRSGWPRL
jgi:hypothetical protein